MRPGQTSEQVRELQARLASLGLFGRSPTGFYGDVTSEAVSAYQRKGALPVTGTTDAVTWDRLRAGTPRPTQDDLHPPTTLPLSKPDKRCLTGRVLCISKQSRSLAWMVDGKVRAAMDVRFGSQYTPTRDGAFKVYWKSRDHHSTLYDTPMPYALFFSGGQAVHYSKDFATQGYMRRLARLRQRPGQEEGRRPLRPGPRGRPRDRLLRTRKRRGRDRGNVSRPRRRH